LARIVDVMLADDRRSWQLGAGRELDQDEVLQSAEGTIDTFAVLKDDVAAATALADIPRRPHAGSGSMDPRA